ncbi:MAG: CinA family protein [Opitutales bacterium]|nr:CinA family protein [Opitutales bacterium]MBP3359165.1 CinA family protein [Opitutales bacterium]
MENPSLTEKAKRIVEIFTRRGKKICVAESCTGGLVASSIVSISGASAVFLGSAVCYCDEAKMKILSVKKEILEKYYAESLQCSQAMAHGAISIFNADYAIATTGFLDANVAPKPADLAGKVFVCLCKKDDFGNLNFECDELLLDTSCQRNVNRAKVAERALDMLLR